VRDAVTDSYAPLVAFRPDVVVVAQGATYDVPLIPSLHPLMGALTRIGAPYVVICQMTEDGYVPPADVRQRAQQLFGAAANVVFVAEQNRISTQRHLGRDIPGAVVLRNPVNLTDLSVVPWPAGGDAPQLAVVGRLHVLAKGQDALFEALAARQFPWRLNLYGRGIDQQYLRDLAAHYRLAERIVFHGHVSDMRQVWAENELLVMPSRFEGTPLALVEAMLCGRPVVATRVGGNAEWITDGVSGFIAEAATASSLGAALDRAFASRGRWHEMGMVAHDAATHLHDANPGSTLLSLVIAAAASPAARSASVATSR
jgi:glycosyltransferase involved in cell wall biosynthesis